ncbi:hypothetical protein N7475_001521 [Penicillium sp. IBT 31633x]|nr:hypothetical protein N7475_001521 [Penicillium sp. IBT 31633x]
MEPTATVFLASPGSIIVAVITIVFILRRTWPLLFRPKADRTTEPTATQASSNPSLVVSKEPELPEGWWTGRDVFELERRALFSQTWLYIAHSAQFGKPGAYQSFDIAGFPVFLIRGKDDKIRAFHNVCRHRAYTITRKETGMSTVLGCRYHGWSYDTTGRLVKAPQFEDIPGFDKSRNSLFEVHTHTTDQGLVFVNLNSGQPAASDETVTSNLVAGLEGKSTWIAGQTFSGDFNWKVGARGRQLDAFTKELDRRVSEISGPAFTMKLVRSIMRKSTRKHNVFFPTTLISSFENVDLSLALSFFPASESKTHIRYDLFSCSKVSEHEVQQLSRMLQTSIEELVGDMKVEYLSISNKQGWLRLKLSYLIVFPALRQILYRLQEHVKLERIQGTQILPAMHKPEGSTLFQQADQLCKELDCVSGGSQDGTSSRTLDW